MWLPEQVVLTNSSFYPQVYLRRPWCHCSHVVSWLSLTDHLGLFSPPPVLCLSGDDCLRSECFLQLPGLARSGQQRGHESDGWGLLLSQLCCGLSHSWVLAQGQPPSSPALLRNRRKLAQMGCQVPGVGTSSPPFLFNR